jgi:predicted nucleic acid-binding protein
VILVDTSVWIDHFRRNLPPLVTALEQGAVMVHPFVVGELAIGHLKHRDETIALLNELPALPVSDHPLVLEFVSRHELAATGIGWIDVHLLSASSAGGVPLWTHDRALRRHAARLALLYV